MYIHKTTQIINSITRIGPATAAIIQSFDSSLGSTGGASLFK